MTGPVGELLSAYLDGELGPDEITEVEQILRDDAAAADELEALRAVRTRVRAAPLVDPPFGLYERMLRAGTPSGAAKRGMRLRWGATAVASAAVWVLVLGFGVDLRGRLVAPDVDEARAAFAAGAASSDRLGEVHSAPDGDDVLVVHQPGRVDWSTLSGGERGPLEGLPGRPWRSVEPAAVNALVFQGDGVAVVIVGDEPLNDLVAVGAGLPDQGAPSLGDRVRDGCAEMLDVFSP